MLRFVDAHVNGQGERTLRQDGESPSASAGMKPSFDHDLDASPAPAASEFTVNVLNSDDSAAGTIAVDRRGAQGMGRQPGLGVGARNAPVCGAGGPLLP